MCAAACIELLCGCLPLESQRPLLLHLPAAMADGGCPATLSGGHALAQGDDQAGGGPRL